MQQSRHSRGSRATRGGPSRVRGSWRGRGSAAGLVLAVAWTSLVTLASPVVAQSVGCTGNAIACENQLPGSPPSEWDVLGAGDPSIQGFTTSMSVDAGQSVSLKISTNARAYTAQVYRLGWYRGLGARKVATLRPPAILPQMQPACLTAAATGLVDCGNWQVSTSWQVPADAVSGVYVVNLVRTDTGGSSHVPLVVRNDRSRSDIVLQTSDTTWQAYNSYGGTNLYSGPAGKAVKVSYNRPFATRGLENGRDYLFGPEYPLIRFLERNGFDVSYISGLDTHQAGSLLLNHRTFLSSGHDEYWSGPQRANVEAARDAGVNLAFLSGNEVYWKTRWEPSIDGSATPGRTLVSYKETRDNAKTDPSPQWTGTWRDPRFSPPSDGGRPENALTGTAYVSNNTDLAVQVSAEEGRRRLWRGTAAATQTPGQTRTLAPHTVGYESDEDLDNGFRPPGLIRLSTTTGPTPEYLRDFGTVVTPGTTTHHLTMYRAPSGALVFGAGTIQWNWGLDATHDGIGAPADPVMQQATINLLADMGAPASTIMAGRQAATRSSDTAAPTTTITSPAAGALLANGTLVTVTGTASDTGGGVVAGVEVSTDSGVTWKVAKGTTSWSFTYSQTGTGAATILARAIDDSVNIGTSSTRTVTTSCPCTLYGSNVPATPDSGDSSAVELGVRFTPSVSGWVTGVRFYKSAANLGTHTGTLWSSTGTAIASGTFAGESATGWQTLTFPGPVPVSSGQSYVASYSAPRGRYAAQPYAFRTTALSSPPLTAPRSATTALNGVYAVGARFPDRSFNETSYWVDVVFDDKDTAPPAILTRTPVAGSSSVAPAVRPSAVLSESITPGSLEMSLLDAAGTPVSGSTSYDDTTRTATYTPAQPLAFASLHTVSLRATDLAGNAMPAPGTWTFRTSEPASVPGVCPCSLWDDTTTPAVVSVADGAAVELGVSFTADSAGQVRGLRFYKGPQNVGTHTGSLWSSTGQRLATATFTAESTAGWQRLTLDPPVTVSAGTTYVASYLTTTGYYSATMAAFGGSGVDSPPLHAATGGGRYRYGGGFPTSTSTTNYWVDVVYTPDTTAPPTVTRLLPADASTSVPVSTTVSATFAAPVQAGSAVVSVTAPSGPVPGTTTYDAVSRTALFSPSTPFSAATAYAVEISGARSISGTSMVAPTSASFRTSGIAACPCTLFASTATPTNIDGGDGASTSVGVKLVPSVDGFLTAVRFYKSTANVGTHTGSVWSAAGARLGTVTFTAETGSGWQSAVLPTAVPVVAGTTYVVSYLAPSGRYSADSGFFAQPWTNTPLSSPVGGAAGNGLYSYGGDQFPTSSFGSANYWVDAVFQPGSHPDTTPPRLSSSNPVDGETSVPPTARLTAVLSEPVDEATLRFSLTTSAGTPVSGVVAYDAANRTATFTPSQPLARATDHRLAIRASDPAGNAPTADQTWGFRTALPSSSPGICPCSIWTDDTVPQTVTANDTGNVELGLTFTADTSGTVSGVRFYKGPRNTGTHTGSLWSASGQQLATATAVGESSAGWQTVVFGSPVAVTAGTPYVVSYRAPVGGYSFNAGHFLGVGLDAPPLRVAAGAGRYTYGTGFPSATSSDNYWVDPVFV